MLVKKEDGTFVDTHENILVELTDDEIDEIIEGFADTDTPYDIFKDCINIHSWYESGDCCEAGRYAEVEDQPDADAFYDDLLEYAEEEFGKISDDSYERLCKAWESAYESHYRESYEESARENYFDDDYDPY